ncbi:MAG: amidohydrolase, partial [Clostridiales bacterium]|nr:amidohydrolase [Clostridiales bacterium]
MILIKNGKIYTMTGEIIDGGSILIHKGKIMEVGQNINEPSD